MRSGLLLKSQNRYSTHFVNFVPFLLPCVFSCMAFPADKLQVVPAQSHTRIRYVLRRDMCLVVDYLSGGEPSVPQAALA